MQPADAPPNPNPAFDAAKPGVKGGADSGGQEAGSSYYTAFGRPANWDMNLIFRVAWQLLTDHWKLWLTLAAVNAVAGAIPLGALFAGPVLVVLTMGAAHTLVTGQSTETPSLGVVWEQFGHRIGPWIGTFLLHMVISGFVIGLGVAMGGIFLAATGGKGAAAVVGGLVMAVCVALAVLFTMKLGFFLPHQVILGGRSGTDAMRASNDLLSGSIYSAVGFMVCIGLLNLCLVVPVTMAISIPTTIAGGLLSEAVGGGVIGFVANMPINILASIPTIFLSNFGALTWLLFYVRETDRG